MIKQSKFLSLILRHDPKAGNITLDENGWCPVDDVVKSVRSKFGVFTHADLAVLVETNDKKRFAFNERGDKIRANQGHSVAVDLGLQPKKPPAVLYHGTKTKFLDSIMGDGLKPASRQHVHLSADIETARNVAKRRSGESVILEIDCAALSDRDFYESQNGVWLTDSVPAAAITVMWDAASD